MGKIIWWWNLVYYFCMKWYNTFGNIICYPIAILYKTKLFEKHWEKKGVTDLDKYFEKCMQPIDEIGTELFLSGLLCFPLMGLSWIINMLLNRYKVMDGITFFLIGITVSAVIVFFPLQNYLLGKNDRYKKYFKEFDKMFKNSVAEKRLYGLLALLTITGLIGLGIFEFHIGGEIMKLNNAQHL